MKIIEETHYRIECELCGYPSPAISSTQVDKNENSIIAYLQEWEGWVAAEDGGSICPCCRFA